MILVDTSVWAAFFNGHRLREVEYLDRTLAAEEDDLVTLPVIVTEVLMGFRTAHGFERARDLLVRLPVIDVSLKTHVAAAALFRALRKKGVTVRGAVDCIIAQTCLDSGASLLTLDRDFRSIARHVPLRLADESAADT
ncbi:MAG: PIN domain nuclease [Myxococcota bacterium]|nr:PIN domain nuclease [Myxococcota bacterium]